MTKQDNQSAEDLDGTEQANPRHNHDIFEIKADLWDAPIVAPIHVHHHVIQRQQFYTGDA